MLKRKDFLLGLLLGFSLPMWFGIYVGSKYLVAKEIPIETLILKDLNGNSIPIENFEGKNVLINFWATWCKPCIEEIPSFEKLKNEMDPNKWELLMVSAEKPEVVNKFLKQRNYSLEFIGVENDMNELGIVSIPRTYVWDSKGFLNYKKVGKIDENPEELIKLIKSLN